jgi:hypothetical protein
MIGLACEFDCDRPHRHATRHGLAGLQAGSAQT